MDLIADKTFYAVVALPFALWALQKAFEGLFAFRQTLRARFLDTTQLLNDIQTNLVTTQDQIDALKAELDGDPSPLEKRLMDDEAYYIFSVSADVTLQIFQADAVQRYSHLDSKLFDRVKEFYDLQRIIAATFESAMSDNFKKLSTPRKLTAIKKLLSLLQRSSQVGLSCTDSLKDEIDLIRNSWWWKALALSHRHSTKLKEQSGDAVT